MKEIQVERVRELATLYQEEGKSWHFHMLTPGCTLNQRDDKHALVLEDRTDDKTWVVYSDQEEVKLGQVLVKMLHGDTILDKEEATRSPTDPGLASILKRIEGLNETAEIWHHHMLFPDCVFNNYPGKWTILIEDESKNETIELLYDEEPVDDLRQIEVRYFGRADPDF